MKRKLQLFRRMLAGILSFTMLMYGLKICLYSQMRLDGVVHAAEIYKEVPEELSPAQKSKENIVPTPLKHIQKERVTKNSKLKKSKKEENYLVITSSDNKQELIKKKFEKSDSIGANSKEFMEKENIITVRMTGEEACNLQDSSQVLRVEKDMSVKASGHIEGRKLIKKKQIAKEKTKKKSLKQEKEWNMQVIKTKNIGSKKKETSPKVKVAVIDSGVDVANDLLVRDTINLIPGEEELLPLFSDITGHGTSVAGIIAAEDNEVGITGINPNVEIYAARVLDNENSAPVSRVVEGIYWAINHNVHIINMSFGTKEDSAILRKAIQDAYSAGILLVAAAGNTGEEVEYPAAYPEVLAVGSVNSTGSISEKSATGSEVELVAPGEKVKSSAGFGTTLICSGTSMAAPHVTGVASLLWEKDLSMSSEFIRKLLAASANHYDDNTAYGYGLIDAEYALGIYDEFKAQYGNELLEDKSQAEVNETLKENVSPVVVYEKNDYVEGSWSIVDHESVVPGENDNDLKKMKLGAVFPDKCEYTWKISEHGAFHGRGNHFEPAISDVGDYIANTIYLSRIAQKGKIIPYQESGMMLDLYVDEDISEFNMIYKQLKKCEANPNHLAGKTEDKKYFYADNKEFLWGIALHCATDAYAHNAFVAIHPSSPNVWYRVIHSKTKETGYIKEKEKEVVGADDYTLAMGRWLCAQHVAQNMLAIYNSNPEESKVVDYKTFKVDDYKRIEDSPTDMEYPYRNYKFKMYKLYTYASRTQWAAMDEESILFEKTMWFWK